MFDIGFLTTIDIKLRSEATSLFDVQRWTFDVRCSVCMTFDVHLSNQYGGLPLEYWGHA